LLKKKRKEKDKVMADTGEVVTSGSPTPSDMHNLEHQDYLEKVEKEELDKKPSPYDSISDDPLPTGRFSPFGQFACFDDAVRSIERGVEKHKMAQLKLFLRKQRDKVVHDVGAAELAAYTQNVVDEMEGKIHKGNNNKTVLRTSKSLLKERILCDGCKGGDTCDWDGELGVNLKNSAPIWMTTCQMPRSDSKCIAGTRGPNMEQGSRECACLYPGAWSSRSSGLFLAVGPRKPILTSRVGR
jgi:hypothetical protein